MIIIQIYDKARLISLKQASSTGTLSFFDGLLFAVYKDCQDCAQALDVRDRRRYLTIHKTLKTLNLSLLNLFFSTRSKVKLHSDCPRSMFGLKGLKGSQQELN